MKKNKNQKLQLNRETLQKLQDEKLTEVAGGATVGPCGSDATFNATLVGCDDDTIAGGGGH